jgi:LacI family transcriptional regulator
MSTVQNISIRKLARLAAVSPMTVSRALRNSDKVREETRVRILEVAREHGYRENPIVRAMAQHISSNRAAGSGTGVSIGFLNPYKGAPPPWCAAYHDHAREVVEDLGFIFDDVHIADRNLSAQRIYDIITARGITGLFLPPGVHTYRHLAFDIEKFAMVSVGGIHVSYLIDRVNSDDHTNVTLAYDYLLAQGYRRIGFYSSAHHLCEAQGTNLASFLMNQLRVGPADRVPPLLRDREDSARIGEWVRRHGIEIVLCKSNSLCDRLRDAGLAVPDEVGVVHLGRAADVADWAGIDPMAEEQVELAVALLSSRIYRYEVGTKHLPRRLVLAGVFEPGTTVRHRNDWKPIDGNIIRATQWFQQFGG